MNPCIKILIFEEIKNFAKKIGVIFSSSFSIEQLLLFEENQVGESFLVCLDLWI